MCTIKERRRVEIFVDGQWVHLESELADIKTGDLYRLFEPTGEAVVNEDGQSEFKATSDSYFDTLIGEYKVVYE
jgi:hypothetical protein